MIHIKGDWYIDVDEWSYNLTRYAGKYTDKNGEERESYTNTTYHRTLADALNQYVTYAVRDALKDKDLDIKDAIDILRTTVDGAKEDISKVTHGM